MPSVNFIKFYTPIFLYEIFDAKISNPKASFVIFGAKISYKKRARKIWWNQSQKNKNLNSATVA
jgi:hypothetical protein